MNEEDSDISAAEFYGEQKCFICNNSVDVKKGCINYVRQAEKMNEEDCVESDVDFLVFVCSKECEKKLFYWFGKKDDEIAKKIQEKQIKNEQSLENKKYELKNKNFANPP